MDQQSEILNSLFLLYVQVEVSQNILKLRSGTNLLVTFSALFLKKNISKVIFS